MNVNVLDTLDKKDLGKKLQQARKQRGLTQADAAELIDVVRTTITAIEKGERRIKADELIRLASAYGRQVSDFVRPRPTVEPFAVRLLNSYRQTQARQVDATEGAPLSQGKRAYAENKEE